MNTITVWWTPEGWMAIHPMLPGEVLPTAFTSEASEADVVAELASRNCGMSIEVRK